MLKFGAYPLNYKYKLHNSEVLQRSQTIRGKSTMHQSSRKRELGYESSTKDVVNVGTIFSDIIDRTQDQCFSGRRSRFDDTLEGNRVPVKRILFESGLHLYW